MENFLISMGILFCSIIFLFLCFLIFVIIENMIKSIKGSRSTTVIKEGTALFNHDKGIKIRLKKDIEIKFKKDKVMRAETTDNRLYGVSWGIHKRHAQSELEKQIVDAIYQDYKNNRDSVLMTDYVRDIRELN